MEKADFYWCEICGIDIPFDLGCAHRAEASVIIEAVVNNIVADKEVEDVVQ